MSDAKKIADAQALLQSSAKNTGSWANMMNEEDALRPPAPPAPPSAPATYKAKTYLPGASKWAANQATIAEEASADRAQSLTPLRNSNIEDIERNKRSYDRYLAREGLPPRANKTPSRERRRRSDQRRRTARRRSPSPRRGSPRRGSPRRRSPSPRRRSRSPVRRYGVGRRYVAAPGFGSRRRSPSPRRRSPSPRYSRRRSPSPRRRSPSPRRRSPSPRYSRRRGSRNVSPLRYTVAEDGHTVNEFGRDVPARMVNEFGRDVPARGTAQGPRFNTRRQGRRPIHVFDEKTKTYKPANWNV